MNEKNKVNPVRSRRLTSNAMNRRQFLKRTTSAAVGVVGFPYIIRSSALGKADSVAASNRIIMGCIGMGTQGTGNMQAFLGQKDVQVVAVCDVRGSQRRKARNIVDQHYDNKACATYNDFCELIARKDIDAVSIAPPDHWHVLIGLEAARAGKDMYYEKPVGLSLSADKTLRNVVNRYGVVFQLGTQQRSDSNFRFACELVRNGRIGKLHTILVGVPGSISFPNQPTDRTATNAADRMSTAKMPPGITATASGIISTITVWDSWPIGVSTTLISPSGVMVPTRPARLRLKGPAPSPRTAWLTAPPTGRSNTNSPTASK